MDANVDNGFGSNGMNNATINANSVENDSIGILPTTANSVGTTAQTVSVTDYVHSDDAKLQMAFAAALLREGDPQRAAFAILPNDPARAVHVQKNWPNLPAVIEEQQRLLEEHGAEYFLPDAVETARNIWHRAQATRHDDDYTKLMKLYADVRGFLKSDDKGPSLIIARKVMLLNQRVEAAPDDDWERMLIEQQTRLTKGHKDDSLTIDQ